MFKYGEPQVAFGGAFLFEVTNLHGRIGNLTGTVRKCTMMWIFTFTCSHFLNMLVLDHNKCQMHWPANFPNLNPRVCLVANWKGDFLRNNFTIFLSNLEKMEIKLKKNRICRMQSDQHFVAKSVKSMPKRCWEVIHKWGGPAKY